MLPCSFSKEPASQPEANFPASRGFVSAVRNEYLPAAAGGDMGEKEEEKREREGVGDSEREAERGSGGVSC